MRVRVIRNGHEILHDGPLTGSDQWGGGDLTIEVINESNAPSDMYLVTQNEWADLGDCSIS